MASVPVSVRFDRFVVDFADERLLGPHGPIHIGNKAHRVLCALIEHGGRLLTKDVLFETVWDGTFVSESALTSVIKELRRALGDETKRPKFIETVYGRGYRFMAPVEPVETVDRASQPSAPIAVILAAANDSAPTLSSFTDKPMIAVLPFQEIGDEGEHWFADGIVEEIVIALSRFQGLSVISTQSSLNYRGSQASCQTIAHELGVRFLLSGSIQRAGKRVRITVKLIDGERDERIWTDRFDDTIEDIFGLQDSIALAVAGRIGSSIEDVEVSRVRQHTANTGDANALYWRGEASLRRMTPDALDEAVKIGGQLLEIEPDNAWCLGFLSFCHGLKINMGWAQDAAVTRKAALKFVDRAMNAGSEDERVLGFCGAALLCIRDDVAVAARLINRAIDLNGGSATALFWGAWSDALMGRPERGIERISKSIRLNPKAMIRPLQLIPLGICLLTLRRFDEAAEVLGESVHVAPQGGGMAPLAVALSHAGRTDQAQEMRERLEAAGGSWAGLELLRRPEDLALVSAALTEPPLVMCR